jgi:N-acetyl-beta-hexosaminidase
MSKIMPRLAAFSETAWSMADRKEWFNYTSRKAVLEAAGWFDIKAL